MADILLGLLAIVAGAAMLVAGQFVLRLVIPVWGFFAGFAFGAGLVAELADERFLGTVLGWVLGLVFAPLAWAMGVHWDEALKAGYLLGVKLMLTEFIAFIQLGAVPAGEMTERTRMILTYALCGFANVGSVGITVTGMGVLMPERRTEIIGIVWKALIAGFLATCMTGALVGAMPRELFGQ